MGNGEGGGSLQDTNHPRLRLVKDQVINFVVPVDQRTPVPGLLLYILEEPDLLIEMRQLPNWLPRFHIHDGGLGRVDRAPRLHLPRVEAGRLAEPCEADVRRLQAMELCQRPYGVPPPIWSSQSAIGLPAAPGVLPRQTHISVLSSADTPGMAGSSMTRPSRNSMT
jgi:hypothetical protein